MFDTDANRSTEERDGVLRDELLESDEESGFEGNVAIDDGVSGSCQHTKGVVWVGANSRSDLTACHSRPQTVDGKCQQIWNHGYKQDELGELLTGPGAF